MTNYKFMFKYLRKVRVSLVFTILGIICSSLLTMPVPYLNGRVVDILIEKGSKANFYQLVFIIFFVHAVKYVVFTLSRIVLLRINVNVINDIKVDMIQRALRFPMEFYLKKDAGYIVARINECNNLSSLFSTSIISSFSAIIDFVFSILIALYIDYRITLIMLIFLPLIAYISHQTAQSLKKHSTVLLEHSANVNNLLFETINSIEAIKLNNYQNKQVDIVSGGLTAFVSSFLKKNKSIVYFAENLSAIARLNSVVLLLIAGVFIFMGELTVGTYVALSQYMLKIVGNVTFFSSIAVQLKPVEVSVERIREFFSYPIEADSGHTQLDVPIKQVKIVDVSYNYNGTKQVLQNLSLQLNAGKHYRLSGKNGSGKSTLLKIISGLYSADAGELFYNSISHRDIGKISLRNRIGFVTHQCHLFKGTILDNVFLETAYNQSRLESVLRKYGIETYVNDFKEGLQTEVKHGGTNLSAGQRQFVSFLRAVLSDKDILFFDEPLSNVDAKTQKKMIEVIGDINDKIVVVISHSSAFDKYIQIDIDEVMEVSSQLEDFQ